MRPQLLLAATALSVACFSVACSDDEPTTSTGGDTGAAIADTGATIADTGTSGTDSSVTAEDTGGTELMDSSADVDAPQPDTASPPADSGLVDAPTADGALPGVVRIHELYIDRNLEGDRVEFIELSGAPGTPIGTLWLRALGPTGSPDWKLRAADAGTIMPASGFWVIGTASITSVNKVYSLAQFGLQNSGGSVQLTDDAVSATTLVDVVGYGTVAAMASTDPKQTTEGSSAKIPASGSTGKTIGRRSVPGDTNNNSADFCVMNQTPGAANGVCL